MTHPSNISTSSTSTKPLVTIIINNYNYEQFISDAINSALAQTYHPVEIIVVDDGSTDRSRDVINSYGSKLNPIFKENGGQASTFNTGFKASQGDVICLLDSDDLFHPEKVLEVVSAFQADENIRWFFHQLKVEHLSTKEVIRLSPNRDSGPYDFREPMRAGSSVEFSPPSTSGLCFSRVLLQEILPMPEAEDIVMSDLYLKLSSMALYKGFYLNRPLGVVRVHSNNRYTEKRGRHLLKGNIEITTAYYLRQKWRFLSRLSNNLFCLGMSDLSKAKKVDLRYQNTGYILSKYLRSISPLGQPKIKLKISFFCLKILLKRLKN
ncbi:putative glycosyltransferase EpsJ [Acaryochloris thomasi RCC1774]|uniref:Putative glycosyltransferase EpsJ n=1 Tax=Acaryochloris thomasi RCC1774 TaxID=1764569 RepID=A0A2W1K0W9_9CYAN|nr:glycosyltransferase family 2 protein [Acaryochloris thomasi]PZD74221.1 putative glycosyltransferase EpsJ [Acaryochloris thomasi RCC1774]